MSAATAPIPNRPLWLWTKISSARWEDAWEERLRFLPPGSCALLTIPGSRALRIRAYTDSVTGRRLVRYFGGKLRRLEKSEWNHELERELTPLRARGRLVVFSQKEPWRAHLAGGNRPPGIFIPASMAFGTGSHPTTAGCLRLLADEAGRRNDQRWTMADLGTGSGILAIAGRKLGASLVTALDCDPVCVRTARTNARTNRLSLDECERMDVLAWQPGRTYDVMTANLFSDILIAAAPILAQRLAPGGALIFSGVLRDQFGEVRQRFETEGLCIDAANPRGKWVFGLCHHRWQSKD